MFPKEAYKYSYLIFGQYLLMFEKMSTDHATPHYTLICETIKFHHFYFPLNDNIMLLSLEARTHMNTYYKYYASIISFHYRFT